MATLHLDKSEKLTIATFCRCRPIQWNRCIYTGWPKNWHTFCMP